MGDNLPALMKALSKQLKEKSMKTRIGAFLVLRELAATTPKALEEYSDLFVEGVRKALMVSVSSPLTVYYLYISCSSFCYPLICCDYANGLPGIVALRALGVIMIRYCFHFAGENWTV